MVDDHVRAFDLLELFWKNPEQPHDGSVKEHSGQPHGRPML